MKERLKRIFGDKAFIMSVCAIIIPMILQNSISGFVNLLDNVMVGQVGTEQMSGVSLANSLLFIFYLCIWGGLGGIGIFTAQFFGSKNVKGVQETYRIKLYLAIILLAVGICVFYAYGRELISLFLSEDDTTGDVALTLSSGVDYIRVMLFGLVPFAVSNVYGSTLREGGETKLPMIGGIVAVFVNLIGNYILIYGHFGAPALGVVGAAIATVISRYVECGIIVIVSHVKKDKFTWVRGLYNTMKVPMDLLWRVIPKALPLLFSEALWSTGMSVMTQCYSTRGLTTIAALNISSTVQNLFNTIYFSMGNAVAILIGQRLGAGETELAKKEDAQLIHLGVLAGVFVACLLAVAAPFIPNVYNTEAPVRLMATEFILVCACLTPVYSYSHCGYFTLRSGGKTIVTFLFDCGFLWCISIPVAFILSRFTEMAILPMYIVCQCLELLKCVVCYFLVRSGVWVNNLVADAKT